MLLLSGTIWTSTFIFLWCLSCEKARNCNVLGLHHSTRWTTLHLQFAVLLISTKENCNGVVERGEGDSKWCVVPYFILPPASCLYAFGMKGRKKGTEFSDLDFYTENLKNTFWLASLLSWTLFLSRGVINYIGLEHPLNAGDMNANVMKETGTAGTMRLNYSIFRSLLYHVINNRKAILFFRKVHRMVRRKPCGSHRQSFLCKSWKFYIANSFPC